MWLDNMTISFYVDRFDRPSWKPGSVDSPNHLPCAKDGIRDVEAMGSQELVQHKAMVVMQSCSPAVDAWWTSETIVAQKSQLSEGDLAIYDIYDSRLPDDEFL